MYPDTTFCNTNRILIAPFDEKLTSQQTNHVAIPVRTPLQASPLYLSIYLSLSLSLSLPLTSVSSLALHSVLCCLVYFSRIRQAASISFEWLLVRGILHVRNDSVCNTSRGVYAAGISNQRMENFSFSRMIWLTFSLRREPSVQTARYATC